MITAAGSGPTSSMTAIAAIGRARIIPVTSATFRAFPEGRDEPAQPPRAVPGVEARGRQAARRERRVVQVPGLDRGLVGRCPLRDRVLVSAGRRVCRAAHPLESRQVAGRSETFVDRGGLVDHPGDLGPVVRIHREWQVEQRVGDPERIVELAGQVELGPVVACRLVLASRVVGQGAGGLERPHPNEIRRLGSGDREHGRGGGLSFLELAAQRPEPGQRGRQAESHGGLAVVDRPAHGGPEVAKLGGEPFDHGSLAGPRERRGTGLGERQVGQGMASRNGGPIGSHGEPGRSRLADRFEHLEPRAAVVVGHGDQALVDQVRHIVQDIAACGLPSGSSTTASSSARQPPTNTARSANNDWAAGSSRSRLQATVSWRVRWRAGTSTLAAPGRASRFARRSRTPATPRRGTRAAASSIPSGRPSSRRQMSAAGSTLSADSVNAGCARRMRSTNRLDRGNAGDLIEDRRVARGRYGQRADGEDLFRRQPEWCPAGRDGLDRRRRDQDLADDAGAGQDLLEVVEHEEQRPIGEIVERAALARSGR